MKARTPTLEIYRPAQNIESAAVRKLNRELLDAVRQRRDMVRVAVMADLHFNQGPFRASLVPNWAFVHFHHENGLPWNQRVIDALAGMLREELEGYFDDVVEAPLLPLYPHNLPGDAKQVNGAALPRFGREAASVRNLVSDHYASATVPGGWPDYPEDLGLKIATASGPAADDLASAVSIEFGKLRHRGLPPIVEYGPMVIEPGHALRLLPAS